MGLWLLDRDSQSMRELDSRVRAGAAGIYHFDDIVVADPHVDPDAKEDGAPEAHAVVLSHDFEAASPC